MKKFSFLALAAVGLLFGACASDTEVSDKAQDPFKGREGGFIKVGISLPVQPQVSTRAWEESATGTLADGLDGEYKVKDCILLLFEGADESSATLKQVDDIGNAFTGLTDNPNQVTTYVTKTVQLLNAPTSNLYALAVVNGTGYIEMKSTTTVSINGKAAEGSFTLSKLQNEKILRSAKTFIDGEGYFFMTNAVLSLDKGGTVDPGATPTLHTLAPVDATRIYETEAEANASSSAPSADIYVERAVAKVTIEGDGTDYLAVTSLKNDDASTVTAATLAGWAIDNYNSQSFLVKNATPFTPWNLVSHATGASVDKYRFIGANPVDAGHTDKVLNTGYRTYWAIDPNYDVDWATGMFITADPSEYKTGIGDDNPQYCFENTFDVAHQIHANTTRVVLKVTLNGGNDFYTVGADKKTLYKLDDVKKKFVTALMGNSIFKNWYNNTAPGKGGSTTLTYDKITLTGSTNTYGVFKVDKVKIDKSVLKGGVEIEFDNTSTDVEGSNLSGVIETANSSVGKVTKYTGGATYYQVRIKHFGDDLTPWKSGEFKTGFEPKESSIADIYPNADDSRQAANYLGRYGMVRNNWYVLKIGAIAKIGSATVPDVNRDPSTPTDPDDPEKPDHPDDELEDAFIKARINILSWAKRVQSWNLK